MHPINESDLDWDEHEGVDGKFKQKQLGEAAGSERLGCSLYELLLGAQPWSYHYHAANEEALYVLSGTGTLRLGGETYTIRDGDYVACPTDESGAHCIINDSEGTLRYLAVSTMHEPDVTLHPDIEKVGVFVGAPPGSDGERTITEFFDVDKIGDD